MTLRSFFVRKINVSKVFESIFEVDRVKRMYNRKINKINTNTEKVWEEIPVANKHKVIKNIINK